MKIVTVIPIARGIFRDYLTYFSAQDLAPGDLVSVLVRHKATNALVIQVEEVTDVKTNIKQANFGMKKVNQLKVKQFIDSDVLEALTELANYYASPLSSVLKNLLPEIMLSQQQSSSKNPKSEKKTEEQKPDEKQENKAKSEILVLQDNDEDRISFYKSLVREAFAKNQSVLICEPTMADLLNVKPILEKGIDHYTVTLYGQLEKKNLSENWQRVMNEKHPLLILTTPNFLSLNRQDLATVIIDRESSPYYRAMKRPLLDYRYFAESLATKKRTRLIFGDILLRTETLHRVDEKTLSPIRPLKQRLAKESKEKEETRIIIPTGGEVLSEEALKLIDETSVGQQKILLLTNRRGLSPLIICDDCGEAVLCHNCQSPLVLHEINVKEGVQEITTFRCHHCGETRTSAEKCRHCQSWRLRALGTGIDRVAKELKQLMPERTVFQFDSDHVKSYRAGEALIKKFFNTPGGILLGTEMVLHYLQQKVTHSVIVTIDSMLTLPDFRINERVFNLLAKLRTSTTKSLLIQTRQKDNEIFEQMARGQLIEFYRQEISERKKYDYPPFKVFIKITSAGPPAETKQNFKLLGKAFVGDEPTIYPSLHQPGRGLLELNLLLKIEPKTWPRADLLEKLKSLTPSYVVSVDPETLL